VVRRSNGKISAGLASRWYSQGRYAQARVIFQGLAALDESSFPGPCGAWESSRWYRTIWSLRSVICGVRTN